MAGRALPLDELVRYAAATGLSGPALTTAVAIALGESGGNPASFNGNASTGDKSYGLWQINMLGSMGPARLKQYGLKSENDLLDPATNARVMYAMSGGGKKWTDWSAYKNGSYKQYLTQVRDAVARLGQNPGQPTGGYTPDVAAARTAHPSPNPATQATAMPTDPTELVHDVFQTVMKRAATPEELAAYLPYAQRSLTELTSKVGATPEAVQTNVGLSTATVGRKLEEGKI